MKADIISSLVLHEVDLKRTERPDLQSEMFYWEGDVLVYVGQMRTDMTKGLSKLSHALKESLKHNLISFTKQGEYAPNTYSHFFKAMRTVLNTHPAIDFNFGWVTQALTNPGFHRHKSVITRFFLHWKERDSTAISRDVLHLLDDTFAHRAGPRNVLSDDPTKSWLTYEEYDDLLSSVWINYDNGSSGTQVTLIRLLSMQYARRPIQIAQLKVGDIRQSDGSTSNNLIGRIVDFPGVKDMTAETGFRDSKFEPHPLADHLWDLCQIQCHEVQALYERTLGFALTDEQMRELPLFCSEQRIKEARQLIVDRYKLNIIENLDSAHFHLHRRIITQILRWKLNTPNSQGGRGRCLPLLRGESAVRRPTLAAQGLGDSDASSAGWIRPPRPAHGQVSA